MKRGSLFRREGGDWILDWIGLLIRVMKKKKKPKSLPAIHAAALHCSPHVLVKVTLLPQSSKETRSR